MESPQLLLGAPAHFDLLDRLKNASSVTMAMAFAKRTGWNLVKEPLLKSDKLIEIIVGLSFGITDVGLLEEWLERSQRSSLFKVRVAILFPTFHPKITLIRSHKEDCAIVGSGNLTAGGQARNVECGVYVNSKASLDHLARWCAALKTRELNQKIIDHYRPFHTRAKEVGVQAMKPSNELAAILGDGDQEWYADSLLTDLQQFNASPKGKRSLEKRVDAAKKIRGVLRMPELNFNKADFEEFYRMRGFGAIRLAYPEMADSVHALRKSLRALLRKKLDEPNLRKVFNRGEKFHVSGFGANQITKVLTVHDRHKWPLLNKRVWKTMMSYGYRIQWSASGYLKFAQDMRKCLKQIGNVDFWSLDAFCLAKSESSD